MNAIASRCPEWYDSLLQVVENSDPCGINLDYDPDFILLQSRLQTKIGAEYGDFVETVEPINWTEVERHAQDLLTRSKDLRLIICLMRCRLRQHGLSALAEGLQTLQFMLTQWPTQVYPQLYDEGEHVPFMRANALAELEGADGFLGDFRQQLLPRVGGVQLSVRDIERLYTAPHDAETPSLSTISAMQQGWQNQPEIASLQQASHDLRQLQQLLQQTLGIEGPDFPHLTLILEHFAQPRTAAILSPSINPAPTAISDPPQAVATPSPESVMLISTPSLADAPLAPGIRQRADAWQQIHEARLWFELNEPSSPVGHLLAFTEQLVGKNFIELQKRLPAEFVSHLTDDPHRN